MSGVGPDVLNLVRAARAAVNDARLRVHPLRAWEALQARNNEGEPQGARPYTNEAFVEFQTAYASDSEDIGLIHHLAIAHHARAWDWELAGDRRATTEWERALNHWRTVAMTGEFWAGLRDKFHACDESADPQWLTEVRSGLLENLLDIHVDFVRHYCETEAPERAFAHVEIVTRARIPPAVKKRLVDKVYEAMTSGVREACARQEHASALAALERFLEIFPFHLPALRQYVETAREWLARLSYLNEWNEIRDISAHTEPHARRLIAHRELSGAPLAQAALEELAYEFLEKGDDRYETCRAKSKTGGGALGRDEAREACEFGFGWGRLVFPITVANSRVNSLAARLLNGLALSFYEEMGEVEDSDIEIRTKRVAMLDLLRPAVALVEESLVCDPGNDVLMRNLKLFREILTELETQQTLLNLFGSQEY